MFGLNLLKDKYPGLIQERYAVEENRDDLILQIGKARLWLSNDGEVDMAKTVDAILKDIRSNKIGRITWQDA